MMSAADNFESGASASVRGGHQKLKNIRQWQTTVRCATAHNAKYM